MVQDAAAQASLILRRYLSEATGEPMLFETHVASISRHEALNDFSEETRKEVQHGFSVLAALKYAPRDTYVSVIHVIVESQRLLKVFHEGFNFPPEKSHAVLAHDWIPPSKFPEQEYFDYFCLL